MDFKTWLMNEKGFSYRGASDVISRLNRAARIIEISLDKKMPNNAMEQLESSDAFNVLSVNIKSQIRRAIKLKIEYES